jgi:membrane dipeptidase
VKRALFTAALLATFGAAAFFGLAPQILHRWVNTVAIPGTPVLPSARAEELYQRLFVADLHSDALLWGRDLNTHSAHGHVDVPRLIAGGVALQGFTVATQFPMFYDPDGTSAAPDVLGLLALAQRWPRSTWNGITERALYQAGRLHETARAAGDRFILLRTADDFESYLARRQKTPRITAGFLGLEGAHALEGSVANLDRLYDAGFRMLGPTHVFDNEVGGSGTGLSKGGLTDFGREVVTHAAELGMIIDFAHASDALIIEILELSAGPFLVSHTGVRATCDNNRNLSDDIVRRIAQAGGLIGIGFFETAVCEVSARAIAAALEHVVAIAGPEHAALGSDFDGGVETPFDATGLVHIVDELLELGMSEHTIELIMGENVKRFLLDALP